MANATLVELVKTLKITRAVVLDEAHEPQLASILPALDDLRRMPENRPAIAGLDLDEAEDEAFRFSARAWWEKLETPARRALLVQYGPAPGNTGGPPAPQPDDVVYAQLWDQWPRETCPVEFLTPSEWDLRWKAIFAEDGAALVLVDLRLGPEDPTGGASRLKALAEFGGCRRIPVIFTNEADGEAAEEVVWDRLVEVHGLHDNYGLVMSKSRMAKVDRFAKQVARAAMTATARGVGDIVAERYGQLVGIARTAFKTCLDGEVFERVVVRASEEEGVHPQETLFRLVDLFLRRARAKQMDEISTLLAPPLVEVRELGRMLDAAPHQPATTKKVRQLRHEEIYTTYMGAGRTTMPPWLGDIWRVGSQLFIHLGQPCDLMLRKSGAREADFFYFVPLRKDPLPSASSLVGSPVPYLKIGNDVTDYWADFKRVVIANANLVDAIALGGPTFSVKRLSEPSFEHVMGGVQERYLAAQRGISEAWLLEGERLSRNGPRILLTGTTMETWTAGQTADEVTVNAERLLRLEGSHATEVLHRFAGSLQRAAHDGDFAKVPEGPGKKAARKPNE